MIPLCSEMVVKQRWGIQVLYGTESYGMLGLSWRFFACFWMCSARMQKRGHGYRLRTVVTGRLRRDFSLLFLILPHLHVCAVTTLCKGRRASWSTYNALTLDLAFFPTNSSRQPLATSKHSCTSPQTTYVVEACSSAFRPLKGLTCSCCYFQLGRGLSQCLQVKYITRSTHANPRAYDLLFNGTGISGFPETYFQKHISTPKHAKQTALSFLELSAMHGNALILSTQLFPPWHLRWTAVLTKQMCAEKFCTQSVGKLHTMIIFL